MNDLLAVFRDIGKLSPQNELKLLTSVQRKEFPARSILQEEGHICQKIYFVESGLARTYYYKDGKDITYWIAMENDFAGSMSSFFMQTPSSKYVETLEDSVLWEFEHSKLESLYNQDQELERMGRLFAYYGISLMESRFDNLHFHSARERYHILLARQPNIIQRVSLGMIASYLGITQETLSRIRKA